MKWSNISPFIKKLMFGETQNKIWHILNTSWVFKNISKMHTKYFWNSVKWIRYFSFLEGIFKDSPPPQAIVFFLYISKKWVYFDKMYPFYTHFNISIFLKIKKYTHLQNFHITMKNNFCKAISKYCKKTRKMDIFIKKYTHLHIPMF